eukprot:4998258-Amphidinium_carterae.1
MASKRARSGDHGVASASLSDSSKLDDLWRKLPDFGRMFALVEQHSKDMQQHGVELAALRARVSKLEDSQAPSSYAGAVSAPTPPPPCPMVCASIFAQQSAPPQSQRQPPPQSLRSPPPSQSQRKVSFQYGSSIAGPNATSPAAERSPTPGLSREQGDRCVLHVTGFASPLSHKEMVAFAKDKLALPSEVKVLTRGYYSQRAALRFPTEHAATSFMELFRQASHVHEGSTLFVQKDLAPHERRMGYMLRAAKRVLLKHDIKADDLYLSNRDGVLHMQKYPILSVFHEDPRFLQRWPKSKVDPELVMAEITGRG